MRKIISERIEKGLHNPDLEKRNLREAIPYKEDMPTPKEWLKYAVGKWESNKQKDLLR